MHNLLSPKCAKNHICLSVRPITNNFSVFILLPPRTGDPFQEEVREGKEKRWAGMVLTGQGGEGLRHGSWGRWTPLLTFI